MLKVTLKSLHIIIDMDGYDFVTLAELFANYIQERQKKIQETGQYIEVETLLSHELSNTVFQFRSPDLYLELQEIEKRNIDLNLYHNTLTRSNVYNNIDYASYNEITNSINYSVPFSEDGEEYIDEIELEILYYDEPLINIIIRRNPAKVESFECPICYEIQKSPNFCVALNCHHNYCNICFYRIINSDIRLCAMCRCPITEGEEHEII